jgi:hypothetical protein
MNKREIEISSQLEVIQGYYTKIFMSNMCVEEILSALERDREFYKKSRIYYLPIKLLPPPITI